MKSGLFAGALSLALLGLVQVFFLGTDFPASPLSLSNSTITSPGHPVEAVKIPFSFDKDGTARIYTIASTLRHSIFSQTKVRVIPDDCVVSFKINGHLVPFESLSLPYEKRCDYVSGFILDLGPYVKRGDNSIEIQLQNNQGIYALRFESVFSDMRVAAFSFLQCLLLAFTLYASLSFFLGSQLNRRGITSATLLLSAGFVIRFLFIFKFHPPNSYVFSDMHVHLATARRWAEGYFSAKDSIKPAAYSGLLALFFHFFDGSYYPMYWVHLLSELVWMIATWRASSRLLGERLGLVVLFWAVIHCPEISMTGFFMPESIFSAFTAVLFWLSTKELPWPPKTALFAGSLFIVGFWFKGNNALFAPLFAVWFIACVYHFHLLRDRAGLMRYVKMIFLFALISGVGAATYTVFSRHAFHITSMSATNGGLNFLEGKCTSKYNQDSEGSYWFSPLFAQIGEQEKRIWPRPFYDQSYFWKQGIDCVKARPAVILTSVRYVYYLFFGNETWPTNVTPFKSLNRVYQLLFSVFLVPGFLFGLFGLFKRRDLILIFPFLSVFSLLLNVWIFKSEMRYRIPFDGILVVLSILGWQWSWTAFQWIGFSIRQRFGPRSRNS